MIPTNEQSTCDMGYFFEQGFWTIKGCISCPYLILFVQVKEFLKVETWNNDYNTSICNWMENVTKASNVVKRKHWHTSDLFHVAWDVGSHPLWTEWSDIITCLIYRSRWAIILEIIVFVWIKLTSPLVANESIKNGFFSSLETGMYIASRFNYNSNNIKWTEYGDMINHRNRF